MPLCKDGFFSFSKSFFIFLPGVNLTARRAGITIGTAAFFGLRPIFCLRSTISNTPKSRNSSRSPLERYSVIASKKDCMTLRTSFGWTPRCWEITCMSFFLVIVAILSRTPTPPQGTHWCFFAHHCITLIFRQALF